MNIALFNWRDLGNPRAGGAEVATHQLALGLAARGHDVTWFTSRHAGSTEYESRSGYKIIRRGSEVTCRFHGFFWLKRSLGAIDVVIDEVNTLPFLSRILAPDRVIVWMHQLAREVWWAETPFPISAIGYALEPALMGIYRDLPVVTISQSSARSFRELGLRGPITVAEIALEGPVSGEQRTKQKTIGYVGRLTPSKRIDHIIRAAAIANDELPGIRLQIIGSGSQREIERLRSEAEKRGFEGRVQFFGRVGRAERDQILSSLDVLVLASMREGWGLVVSEAARYGVPSAVYPVAGLVDSVKDGETGIVASAQSPEALAKAIVAILKDRSVRNALGDAAARYLREFDDERFIGKWEAVLRERAQ